MADEYLSLRKVDTAPPKLALETFIRLAGDRDVVSYTRDDAKLFLDVLLKQGNKTATIRLGINCISAIMNYAYAELDVDKRTPETPSTICSKGFPQYLLADTGWRYFPRRAIQLKQCGSFPQLNTFGMFCGECSSPTYLQHLCCQRFSCSSSLHEGYDEPEILLDQIVKSVPNALTLDKLPSYQQIMASRHQDYDAYFHQLKAVLIELSQQKTDSYFSRYQQYQTYKGRRE